ncbi:MAG: hypothetical protein AAF902_06150 [Chloroflexota bacterium]
MFISGCAQVDTPSQQVAVVGTRRSDVLAKTTLVYDSDSGALFTSDETEIVLDPTSAETTTDPQSSNAILTEPDVQATTSESAQQNLESSPTPTLTETPPPVATLAKTQAPTESIQNTPTPSPTSTPTFTPSPLPTVASDSTPTVSSTATASSSPTPVGTSTETSAATPTAGSSDSNQVDARIIVKEAEVPVGETVSLPLRIRLVESQLDEIILTINYDTSIISLEDCNMAGNIDGECKLASPGTIYFEGINSDTSSDNIALAFLSFQGESSGDANLEISDVDTLIDLSGNTLVYVPRMGPLTVP